MPQTGLPVQGSIKIRAPHVKNILSKIFIEFRSNDSFSETSIQFLTLELLSLMQSGIDNAPENKPLWLKELTEMIHEEDGCMLNLKAISNHLNLHPAYISRVFHKFTGTTFGKYSRAVKLQKAIHKLQGNKAPYAAMAHDSGFFDQSHFIANFKREFGITPGRYLSIAG